jgi:large subunit ribosomal protein L28
MLSTIARTLTSRATALVQARKQVTNQLSSLSVASSSWLPSIFVSSQSILSINTLDTQVRFRSNRSRRGLYDGKDVRFGNKVSFSNKKTRRKFKPNVFIKRLYSETLDSMLKFHVTTSALRSIDRMGGLDNYLMRSKHVTEGEGLKARQKIKRRIKNVARWEAKKAQRAEGDAAFQQGDTPAAAIVDGVEAGIQKDVVS